MMNMTQNKPQRADVTRLLKLVQVGRRELGMTEDDYRSLLERVTGSRSAKGLGAKKLDDVVQEMKRLGFVVRVSRSRRHSPPSSSRVRAPEVRKIRAIWICMHNDGFVRNGSEDALNGYIKRMTARNNGGAGIERAEWLTSEQAYQVLEALKKWHIRLMSEVILKRGDVLPESRSYQSKAMPGYDLIRLVYENPGWRPGMKLLLNGVIINPDKQPDASQ